MSDVNYKKVEWNNGVVTERDMTTEEKAELDAIQKPVDLDALKLAYIRKHRNRKLAETDYLALSDQTMTDAMKTYRQNLRNIPSDYDSSKYDELVERNTDGSFKHSVWTKPS
tara:strand:+ start:239 stop:574 length:336 start_codon:yes stop_codon:yes gene_type:complete